MKVTIVPGDTYVAVNGIGFSDIDVTLSEDIHAVQWDGDSGWIEYKENGGVKPANQTITDLSQFDSVLQAWQVRYEESLIVPPPPPPPTLEELRAQMNVTPFQAKAALLDAGLLDDIEALMSDPATDRTVVLAWNNVTEFRRLSPMVAGIAAALGWSDEQLDSLFAAAALKTA